MENGTLNQDVFPIEHWGCRSSQRFVRKTRGYCKSFRTKMSFFFYSDGFYVSLKICNLDSCVKTCNLKTTTAQGGQKTFEEAQVWHHLNQPQTLKKFKRIFAGEMDLPKMDLPKNQNLFKHGLMNLSFIHSGILAFLFLHLVVIWLSQMNSLLGFQRWHLWWTTGWNS